MGELSKAHHLQRRTLLVVLVLNALLFVGLGAGGLIADSSALQANAADNASDSAVYLLSFLAVGRSAAWKRGAARLSGVLLLVFAAGVILDVGRRWLFGAEPFGPTMMGLAFGAAIVNLACPLILRRAKSDDVNMRAAETFSLNDFAANGGILVAGGLVMWLRQPWPDLVVGVIVASIAVKGGLEILESAKTYKGQERLMARSGWHGELSMGGGWAIWRGAVGDNVLHRHLAAQATLRISLFRSTRSAELEWMPACS